MKISTLKNGFGVIALLFLLTSQLFAQPRAIHYQAVARDADGDPIANETIFVKFSLLSQDGTLIWEESHQLVTNQFGLFNVDLFGNNADRSGGTAATYDQLEWATNTYSLKLTITFNAQQYHMPTEELKAVPYALYALSGGEGDVEPVVQDLQLSGGILKITNNPSATEIDLDAYNSSSVGWERVSDNVTYSAGNVGVGTSEPSGRLSVQAVDETADQPLFMVKRQDGYPVFAVYDHGVYAFTDTTDSGKGIKGGFAVGGYHAPAKGIGREYMRVTADSIRFYVDNDPKQKGLKGGFAVGGYQAPAKSSPQDFLRVTPDSIRMYIDDDPASKGLKGGFAVGGYHAPAKGPGAEYFNISAMQAAEVIPGENRLVWYPQRNAFLTGRVLVQSASDVGVNSMASGYESKAKGDYSQAFGFQSETTGPYSAAIGQNALADTSSFAFGKNANATGNESFAFGSGAEASGLRSIAMGSVGLDSLGVPVEDQPTSASGNYSMALGLGSEAKEKGSMSFGVSSMADDEYAVAIGYGSRALGLRSTAIGSRANFSESVQYPAPFNYFHLNPNTSYGAFSITLGSGNSSYDGATSIGLSNVANGFGSVALGYNNETTRKRSIAAGYRSEAIGDHTVAIGNYVTAKAFNSMAIGSFNVIEGDPINWVENDPLFVIGNGEPRGSITVRSNAFEVQKDGDAILAGTLYADNVSAPSQTLTNSLTIGRYIYAQNIRPYIALKEYSNLSIPQYSKEYQIKASGKVLLIEDESNTLARFSPSAAIFYDNVGIGTTVPLDRLDVNGDMRVRGGDLKLWYGTKSLYFRQDGSDSYISNKADFVGNGSSSNGYLVLNGEEGIKLNYGAAGSSGTIGLFMDQWGSVGIGTTSPFYRFHVKNNVANNGAVRGESTYSGASSHYAGAFIATTGTRGTGVYAAGSFVDYYAAGPGANYAPFTGSHEVTLQAGFGNTVKPGMIVSMTGRVEKREMEDGSISISSTMPEIKLADRKNDKAVLGAFVSENSKTDDHWMKKSVRIGTVNALGEGRVWVCEINGDIEAGDLITTSNVPGYGMLQEDDLIHSYTLGKATETIHWDQVSETIVVEGKQYRVYLIGVIYTSG